MTDSINLVQKKRAQLQSAIGDLGTRVIHALQQSVICLKTHDLALAAQIIAADAELTNSAEHLNNSV
ncbi:hypothetical protein [Chromatium okenii]|uniref:hypothetical protein n=1 Tax=Chromatium okenii TaxID=61644 RepID=UPI001F5B889E|nr:hypothetical protein [Chromatium okenii]